MKLSIGILVSNRKAYIRNCMESIKPILEQISSELIAVDTVGTENSDGSIDIVREYTDKIYRFEWCNDFSAARNVLLDHANGEWFDNVDELIRFFDTNEYKNYRSATYVTHDYLKKDGEEYTCSRVSRMAKRTDTLRFVGIIHEVLNEMYFPSKELDIFTHHYGYAYTNNEERKKHSERNLGLLMTAIEEHPRDLRLRSQLALEYINIDSNEAFSYICDVLPKFVEDQKNPCFQWMLSQLFVTANAMGASVSEILELYRETHQIYSVSEFAEISICYNVAVKLVIAGKWTEGAKFLEAYLKLYDILMKNAGIRQSQNVADFESYISPESLNQAKELLDFTKSVQKK